MNGITGAYIDLPNKTTSSHSKHTAKPNDVCKNAVFTVCLGASLLVAPNSSDAVGLSHMPSYDPYIRVSCISSSNNYSASDCYDLLMFKNLEKLECMRKFSKNWNGTGGERFLDQNIDFFEDIIKNVSKQPDIAPTGRNSLYMQYVLNDNSLLAFEVRNNSVEKLLVPKGDYELAETQVYMKNFIEEINRSVGLFYGSYEN